MDITYEGPKETLDSSIVASAHVENIVEIVDGVNGDMFRDPLYLPLLLDLLVILGVNLNLTMPSRAPGNLCIINTKSISTSASGSDPQRALTS